MLIPVIIILIAAASFTMVVLVKNNNPLHNVLKSGRVRGVCCTFLLVCLPLILFQDNLYAQPGLRLYSRDYSSAYGEKNREVFLDIECHSGTPPVLEFLLKDREYIVSKLDFDFESDGEIDLVVFPRRAEENEDNVVFRGAPYRQKGVYNPTVYIHTPYGTFLRRFNIGYADFIWGRDNFNFANDGKFENAVDFVSWWYNAIAGFLRGIP
jgi:hypothetical protein